MIPLVSVRKSPKDGWSVWEVDGGFRSQDKWLQDLVDEYNGKRIWWSCKNW